MQRQRALSVKVPDSTASISSPPSAGGSRSLFVLSITIQLFELDTRFMTTSIHLLVSDDSVAHTPLMYSERSGRLALGKRHTSHLIARSSLMNHAAVDISASSKDAFHLTSVINQKGTFIVTAKKESMQITGRLVESSVDEMRPRHNGVTFMSFVYTIFVAPDGFKAGKKTHTKKTSFP